MYNIVFLDLDDTIFDFGYAEEQALRTAFAHMGIEPSEVQMHLFSEINDAHWKRLERGELTRREVQIGRFAAFFETIGIGGDAEQANRDFMNAVGESFRFLDGAEQLLKDLRARGKRMYVVSNASRSVQMKRLEKAGILNTFDGIFLSEDLGVQKPERLFFQKCFARVSDMKLDQPIILGDSLTSDILGGIRAGIATCWYNPKQKKGRTDIVPSFEIGHLSEFLNLI